MSLRSIGALTNTSNNQVDSSIFRTKHYAHTNIAADLPWTIGHVSMSSVSRHSYMIEVSLMSTVFGGRALPASSSLAAYFPNCGYASPELRSLTEYIVKDASTLTYGADIHKCPRSALRHRADVLEQDVVARECGRRSLKVFPPL